MNLLYICSGNVFRSQLAESITNLLADPYFRASSAGVNVGKEKEGDIITDIKVLDSAGAVGYQLDGHYRKLATQEMVDESDLIIIMTLPSQVPDFINNSGKVFDCWIIPDNKYKSLETHINIALQVEKKVTWFIREQYLD